MTDLPDEAEVARRVALVWDAFKSGENEWVGESGRILPVLVEPSPEWPAMFAERRDRLTHALGAVALRIEHVGSTSVPGAVAKPIIDIQISVADIDDEDAYRAPIESLGWSMRAREPAAGHRYFREPAGVPRTTHIHVCQAGGEWERKHLLFRDYLRSHPARVREYEAVKRAARDRYGDDGIAYTEAKGPFIEATLDLAATWAADTGWQP